MLCIHGPILILLFVNLATTLIEGSRSRILVLLPMPFASHAMTFGTLAQELAMRGHNVTIVTTKAADKSFPNYREVLIDRLATWGDHYKRYNFSEWRDRVFQTVHNRNTAIPSYLEKALQTEQIQKLLHSEEKFDAVLAEFLFFQQPLLAFGARFNASLIDLVPAFPQVSSVGMMGNPMGIAYLPDTDIPFSDRMTFTQRLYHTIFSVYKITYEYLYILPTYDEMMRRCLQFSGAESLPPIKNLMERVSLHLVNSHFTNHYPRPYAPNAVEIGGFHIRNPDPLPLGLLKFMDDATDGVILVSFGTNVKPHMISKEKEESIAKIFKGLKARVLWAWENEGVTDDSSKLLVKKWLPQQSILAHPKCILYVTHGGLASLTEGIYYGVPFVGVPFFVDQFHNVEFIKVAGIGFKFDIFTETAEDLVRAVSTVLNTPSFRENVKTRSMLMRDQPQTPMDRAIYWIEYVIRHNGAHHLKPESMHLPFYQYFLLDVLAFILIVTSVAVIALYQLIILSKQTVSFFKHLLVQHRRRFYDKPFYEQIYIFVISFLLGITALCILILQKLITKVSNLWKSEKLEAKES